MRLVIYGGDLEAPYCYAAGPTVYDPLTAELADTLLADFRPVVIGHAGRQGLLGDAYTKQEERFDELLERGMHYTVVWEQRDYEAQLTHLTPETWSWSDWEPVEDGIGDQERRSMFLGTIMNLSPSGKVYYPFACSNVESCPCCGGAGDVPNWRGDPDRALTASTTRQCLVEQLITRWGPHAAGRWPPPFGEIAAKLQQVSEKHKPAVTCPLCDGVGSAEAHQDQNWREAFEKVLDSHGLVLESGEGDPCDLFAVEYRESVEAEEQDED